MRRAKPKVRDPATAAHPITYWRCASRADTGETPGPTVKVRMEEAEFARQFVKRVYAKTNGMRTTSPYGMIGIHTGSFLFSARLRSEPAQV